MTAALGLHPATVNPGRQGHLVSCVYNDKASVCTRHVSRHDRVWPVWQLIPERGKHGQWQSTAARVAAGAYARATRRWVQRCGGAS
jgi:hypothetical protein